MSACRCQQVLVGSVKDRKTNEFVTTAKIAVTNPGHERSFKTDSTGYFEAYLYGGYGCPRIRARIEADGYKSIAIRQPKKRDTITVYLEKLE